jgi:hypothetical protein
MVRLWFPVSAAVSSHPEAGDLTFEYSLFRLPDRADLNVVLHTPYPDTGTKERVERLPLSARAG